MANTSKIEANPLSKRDLYYYRRRYVNRLFSQLTAFFAEQAERDGVTKSIIAKRLQCDPALVTRWLSHPSNLEAETISDILLAMGAEPEPPQIVRFGDRRENYTHPLIGRITGQRVVRDGTTFETVVDTTGRQQSVRIEPKEQIQGWNFTRAA